MKWIKVCVLLLLTLSAMRAGSWTLGWILAKLAPAKAGYISAASNLASFALFVGLLLWNLFPGESLDMAACLFGLAVFGACWLTDLYWTPWKARTAVTSRR